MMSARAAGGVLIGRVLTCTGFSGVRLMPGLTVTGGGERQTTGNGSSGQEPSPTSSNEGRLPDAQEHVCFACVPASERVCYTCPKLMMPGAGTGTCEALGPAQPSADQVQVQQPPGQQSVGACPFEDKGCLQSDCSLPCLAQDYQV